MKSPTIDRLAAEGLDFVKKHWDAEELRQKVISALRVGKYTSWGFNPASDALEQYIRSHMDLTRLS